jgi:hypothetical protein
MNPGSTSPARQGWSAGWHAVCFRRLAHGLAACLWLCLPTPAWSAATVPMDVQMPGTQPGESGNLESPDKCDNCHQDDNPVVTIAHDWRGSMMSHAGRDPIFWATLAIAEQDFDGSGDLCIRCHMMGGWQAGHSTPPDGSPDTRINAADLLVCMQLVLGLKETTTLEKAHADLYPVGAPDGKIDLNDFNQLQKLVLQQECA